MSNYYLCDTCAHCGGAMRDSTTFVKCHARDRTRETYLPVQRLAAEAGHPVLAEMMARYHEIAFYREDGSMYLLGCPHVNTDVLVRHGLVRNGQEQTVAGFHVYPADWFNPLDSATGELIKTANTVSIHWYSMSWIPMWKRIRVKIMRKVRKLLKKRSSC